MKKPLRTSAASDRICDGTLGGHPCPRRSPCEGGRHFNNAGLDPELDKRWLETLHSDTALIAALWALVVVVVLSFALGILSFIRRLL